MVITVILTGLALIRFEGKKLLFHFLYIEVLAVIGAFYWLTHDQSYVTLACISVVFSILIGVIDAIALGFLGGLFKSSIRGIGMNMTFTLPAVFFGGFFSTYRDLVNRSNWGAYDPSIDDWSGIDVKFMCDC